MACFLIDESMPTLLAPKLRSAGYKAVDAREIGHGGQPDSAIYEAAERLACVLITKDKDFADERDFGGRSGVIIVRTHPRLHREVIAGFVLGQIRRYETEIEDLDRTIMVIVPGHRPRYRLRP